MHKITVLYGHPENVEAFEDYYKNKHLPLVANMKGIAKLEYTKLLGTPDGKKGDFYRMAELYFSSPEQMQETMSSPEGQATSNDLSNFATGGAIVLIGTTETN